MTVFAALELRGSSRGELLAPAFAAAAAARSAAPRDPYYSARAVRFEPSDADVPRTPGDLVVANAGCGVELSSERARARVEVCGVSRAEAEAVVRAIDGARTVADIGHAPGVPAGAWERVAAAAFGVVVLAPEAVAELESRVPSAEIVRYPGSPYEVVRAYWRNMAEVRGVIGDGVAPSAPEAFAAWLSELNVVALAGRDGRSFYVPASPAAAKEAVVPGRFVHEPSVVEPRLGRRGRTSAGGTRAERANFRHLGVVGPQREARGPTGGQSGDDATQREGGSRPPETKGSRPPENDLRFVSGLRVNAAPIGGAHYHALLAERTHDLASLDEARAYERGGVDWGRLVTARADADDRSARWFCPPRPMRAPHFASIQGHLAGAIAAADAGAREAVLPHLAGLHQAIVRLHPFRAGNQCLAMSLVNGVLRRSHGAGIPHLILDHLALCLSTEAYAAAFDTLATAWLVRDSNPVARLLELIARKERAFALLARVGAATSLAEARDVVRAGGAAAALLGL